MNKNIEEFVLRECSKQDLTDRDKVKYILEYKEKYNLTWKEIANISNISVATLKSNLKLLQIPEEEFKELKELGFTQKQMKTMMNPPTHDERRILGNILNKLSTITNPEKELEPIIKKIERELSRIKDIIQRRQIQ